MKYIHKDGLLLVKLTDDVQVSVCDATGQFILRESNRHMSYRSCV